ncbi:hypothetical protein HMPREF0290_0715 [Corynebacterium efficiens YS-314]|nr:hypothetical protein HMPREF0290_0715 [Corynebacterium efficiens YS-314]
MDGEQSSPRQYHRDSHPSLTLGGSVSARCSKMIQQLRLF